MKTLFTYTAILLAFAMGFSSCGDKEEDTEPTFSGTIWKGSTITFQKDNYADWHQEANQDRITDKVWITRADNEGIFNYKTELGYQGSDNIGRSPEGTEWALGTTSDDVESLEYSTWAKLHNGGPLDLLNRDLVVHLKEEDIYLDLKFTSWSSSGSGGGFSYERSTP